MDMRDCGGYNNGIDGYHEVYNPSGDVAGAHKTNTNSVADFQNSDSAETYRDDLAIDNGIRSNSDGSAQVTDKGLGASMSDKTEAALLRQDSLRSRVKPLSSGLEAEVTKYARTVASWQFEKHIQTLETTTDADVFKLCYVGHWRWLAKQEVSRWVDGMNISAELKQQMMKVGEDAVVQYDKEHHKQHRDAIVKCKNRVKSLFFIMPTVSRKEYVGNGEYRELRYGEDGKWAEVPSESAASNRPD